MNEEIINKISSSDYKDIIKCTNDEFTISEFEQTTFFEIIDFIKKTLAVDKRIIVLDDCTKSGGLEPIVFSEPIDISHCIFEKKFILRKCKFEKEFTAKYVEFKGETSFKECIFNNKTRFHHTKFRTSINFENTTFNSLIDFYEADFFSPQKFFLTDFLNVAIFSNVTFHDQIQFVYNKVKSESIISFENAICKQSIDISRSNFWCKLQFWGITIEKNIPDNIWLYETDKTAEQMLNKLKYAFPRIRETYRMIKHAYRQEGNNIEALKFHQKELFVFKAENEFQIELKLFQRLKSIRLKNIWSKIILFSSKVETYITIRFNYISNNFGQSWLRGIVFTLLATLLFFSIFLQCSGKDIVFEWKSDAISLTTKYFLQFLNIAKWDYSPFGIDIQKSYHVGYIILFVGRIFIGYGYYQIIQAFRKFGKN
jgi:hypothetical protein